MMVGLLWYVMFTTKVLYQTNIEIFTLYTQEIEWLVRYVIA